MNSTTTDYPADLLAQLSEWLPAHGLKHAGRGEWGPRYANDKGSVAIDDGTVTLYVLDPAWPAPARMLAWEVRYTNAPLPVITDAISTHLLGGAR